MRRSAVGFLAIIALAGLGLGVYARYFRAIALAETPQFQDSGDRLPTPEEFEAVVQSDPVKMLEICLTRYQRENTSGMTAKLVKRERVNGEPKPPKEPQEEVVQLSVRNDVTGDGSAPRPQVRMVWESGARKVPLFGMVNGTLFIEEHGGGNDDIQALVPILGIQKTKVGSPRAKDASRYCMRDAGLYGAMLRSHTVWKKRQDDGALHWRFVEKRPVEQVGGRMCYVVERTCPSPEVDPFEIGGEPNLGGKTAEEVGSVRVTLFIDVEKWLQVGSELHRQDGNLLAGYYFRDIGLNPNFAPDTFTADGLKKAVAALKK